MNTTRLENDRGIIPNTFGRLLHSGGLRFGQCWTVLLLYLILRKSDFLKLIPGDPRHKYA